MGAPLSQGPHGELEGAAGHVGAVVLDAHRVHAGLRGHEADAVGVVLPLHDVRLVHLSRGTGHLRRHVGYADLWGERRYPDTGVTQWASATQQTPVYIKGPTV